MGGGANTVEASTNVTILGGYEDRVTQGTNVTILGGSENTVNQGTNIAVINSAQTTIDGTNCTNATIIGATSTTATPPSNTVSVNGLHNRGAKYVDIVDLPFNASVPGNYTQLVLDDPAFELYYIHSDAQIYTTCNIFVEDAGAPEKKGRVFEIIFNIDESTPPAQPESSQPIPHTTVFQLICASGSVFYYKTAASAGILTSNSNSLFITRNETASRPLKNTIRFIKISDTAWLVDQPLDFLDIN